MKTALLILDGWAIGNTPQSSAIAQAKTPFIDSLYKMYPNSTLRTYGKHVGLPDGQMGNSEVGHMNIGAGRIVHQDFVRINNAIEKGDLKKHPVLQEAFAHSKKTKATVHFMGLVSEGGVHAHQNHLTHLVQLAREANVENLAVHAFTDGRDTDPKSGIRFLAQANRAMRLDGIQIGSVIGRYYAMDRDLRWDRIAKAHHLLTRGEGQHFTSVNEGLSASYAAGVTDEFIEPFIIPQWFRPIKTNDVVICFNFRTDRCRQLTRALTQENLPKYNMKALDLHYLTMTRYDKTFQGVKVLFENNQPKNTLGEVLSNAGKTQLRMAETEKYPHVTFFFNGGREESFTGEQRIVVPSPKVATYDLQPEMSAGQVTDQAISYISEHQPDFICLNYANPDMVAHTGDFKAGIKACETVDRCASILVKTLQREGYEILITSDHGNADYMINEDGSPNTAHTKNPVPLFLLSANKNYDIADGILGDIAPTILQLMNVKQPVEMTGKTLLR